MPRLWRSRTNRVIVGVLGGLAEKFGIEARPMRILYGMAVMATFGFALVPYAAMWAITGAHGPTPPVPRFWRSRAHRVFSGMLGGLSEKWGASPVVIRTLYAGVTVATGVIPGVLAYLVTWMATRPLDEP